ncbi:MAG: hypothetical protein RR054_01680 [Clostridia bacterium]
MSTILTPFLLWKDYDTPERSLNVRVVLSYIENDLEYTELYFDGRCVDNKYVRVFAITAIPVGAKNLPVMVLIDGIERDIDKEKITYWANNGYAAVGVDYCGGAGIKTVYPDSLDYCNYSQSGRHYSHVDTTADETVWYNWAYCVRRAITYMLSLSCVNGKINLYSLREASKIAMMVLGVDKRIRAGAVLFGSCWEQTEFKSFQAEELSDMESAIDFRIKNEEEKERMLAGVSPQTYAALIEIPMLIVQGTNSTITDMTTVYDAVNRMKNNGNSTVLHIPRMMDTFDSKDREMLKMWFENPEPPKLVNMSATQREGKLILKADLKELRGVSDVKIYYSRGIMSQSVRNWVLAKNGTFLFDEYEAEAEIVDLNMPITVICNLINMGRTLSSHPMTIIPSSIGVLETVERTKLIYKGKQGLAEFVPMNPSQPQTLGFVLKNTLAEAVGAYDVSGVSGKNIATYCLNDPMYIFDAQSALTFDVYSAHTCDLTVYLATAWGTPNMTLFRTVHKLVGGQLWQKVSTTMDDFKSVSGKFAKDNLSSLILAFSAEQDIVLNNILFT